jgi:hypothetical protein
MTKYNAPVSLAVLWQRWQEIEGLPEHDKAVLAELAAMEERFIEWPADNPADLLAKLKFLAHLARDHDWNDRLEKLYGSIEGGLKESWFKGYRIVCDMDDDLSRIENMSRALSIFTIAEEVWNDERDSMSAQALLFALDDGCKNLREAQEKLGDLTSTNCSRLLRKLKAAAAEVEGGAA